MLPSGSGLSAKAIGWALLSQAVWLPLVAIDLHDRWISHQRHITPPGKPLPPSPLARATPFSLNDLLGAARPVQQLAGQANQAVSGAIGQTAQGVASGVGLLLSSAGSSASSLLDRPFSVSLDSPAAGAGRSSGGSDAMSLAGSAPSPSNTVLGRAFTRAQLLGGSISLSDLQEGAMAPLALAERALQRSSGDPLAPLPSVWREPIRQALLKLPGAPRQLSPARMVHVPSSAVSQPVEVPLALQSDGSVDILETPSNAAVLREIDGWSRQQRRPATGSLTPAVVHLHPLAPEAPLTSPSATRPAASTATPAAALSGVQQPGVPSAPRAIRAEVPPAAPPQSAPTPPPAPEPAAFVPPAEVLPAPAPEPVAAAVPAAAEVPAEAAPPAP
jgi:hypothetical protein